MAKRHYTIFCDESSKKGPFFSNFYGGAIVSSPDRELIEESLRSKKEELNLFSEIKWTSITENYQDKYIEFIKYYFEFVKTSRIKIRIMFTQNTNKAKGLTQNHHDNQYFILYYQMIKHAFGIKYCNPNNLDSVSFSIFPDRVPDKKSKLDEFRKYISNIPRTRHFSGLKINIPIDQIADIDSKNHAILQGLDIILGSMFFRLNDLHKAKPDGKKRRGKRTVAKEKVYKSINTLIREIRPGFNIGVSTSASSPVERWNGPYRHWLFVPQNSEKDHAPATKKPR